MTEPSQDLPFGTFRLSPRREWLRRRAELLPEGRLGRMGASLIRRALIGQGQGPVDVEVFPSINARLYPSTNRCEKRAVVGVKFFDREERDFMANRIEGAPRDTVAVVDLGANVGLYGLSAVAAGRNIGKGVKVLAVEPDAETRRRLEGNIAFSGALETFTVVAAGVGARRGTAYLAGHATNRGQHRVVDGDGGGDSPNGGEGHSRIEILPLLDICRASGFDRIDILKIDVEGFDYDVLAAFYASAPQTLWPEAVIVEVGRVEAGGSESDAPVVKLLGSHGYELAQRTKLNALMVAGPGSKR